MRMQNGYLLVSDTALQEQGTLRTGTVTDSEPDTDNNEQWYPAGCRVLFDPADAKKVASNVFVLHMSEVLAVVADRAEVADGD